MASQHVSAKEYDTFEQAGTAAELVMLSYRVYMDTLYQVYPQVGTY